MFKKFTPSITSRNANVNSIFRNIRKFPICSHEEAIELSKRIQETGDQQARNRLVEGNLRLVITVAKQYATSNDEFADMIQEGYFGLIDAARQFNGTLGCKFSTYAIWPIRKAIMNYMNNESRLVRIPHNQTDELTKLKKAVNKFQGLYGHEPNEDELADFTGLKSEKITDLMNLSLHHSSLDESIDEEDGKTTLLNFIPNEADTAADFGISKIDEKIEVNRYLTFLEPRKSAILKMVYGIGCQQMKFEEIGTKLDISSERVRQLHAEAIKDIQKRLAQEHQYTLAA